MLSYIKLFSREYAVSYTEASIRAIGPEASNYIPVIVNDCFYLPEGTNEVICANEQGWNKFVAGLDKGYRDVKKLLAYFDDFHYWGRKYVSISQKIGSLSVSGKSNNQLAADFEKYFKAWIIYTTYVWTSFYLNEIWSRKAHLMLEAKTEAYRNYEQESEFFFAPAEKFGILELEEELLPLKRRGVTKLPVKLLTSLVRRWRWIPCLDLNNAAWNASDFQNFYSYIVPSGKRSLSFAEVARLFSLTRSERDFLKTFKKLVAIKDERDVFRRQGVYAIRPFYEAMARRLGLTLKEVSYLTKREILSWLREGQVVNRVEIARRQKSFALRWLGNDIEVSTDERVIGSLRKLVGVDQEKSLTEISGIIASKGQVSGKAVIIKGVNDLIKVQTGDIFVAITTHPDFIVALKKSRAFVTDEGGLTSHAAIVARELKKPCIVGTKIATKVLKDGDLVEVDADKGVVRIIKRH